MYTISVNRLRESLNGTSSAFEGRSRFARELINMRESLNGMASAFEGRSRFARERESVRRPAEGTPLGVSADTRFSLHLLLKLKKRESRLMVWRQLPKLIPAGSIPVSRSKQKEQAPRLFFFYLQTIFFKEISKICHSANNFFISSKPFSIKTPVCLALSSS